MTELLTKSDLPAVTARIERLEILLERQVRQITFRFGIMLAVGFGALAAFLKLT